MIASKYFESTPRTKEILKETITFIGAHELSAHPINYTVCYEYFRGVHLGLKQQIDKTLAAHKPLNDQLLAEWFITFCTGCDQEKLEQSQADLIKVITNLNSSAAQVEDNVTRFDNVLRINQETLDASHSPDTVELVINQLMDNTRIMHSSMELMQQQIQESRQEINYLQEKLEKATEEALTDPLTGLANRNGLTKAIEQINAEAIKTHQSFCLIMLDIDHFKKINDTYGHILGDKVIKIVADTVRHQLKGKDTAARYGGEEFCVLLPETTLDDGLKLAEHIREVIEKTEIKKLSGTNEVCRVTISAGVASFKSNEQINQLFERADDALYRSKKGGRNQVTCAIG